ncbi:mitochondrial 37S ribosomal protein MRPS5 [Paracoccidioides lutzii Pb01]|uniref:Small ribosomal subunit protein uS5m n=1 Tax=Paracoccidioides lutzii (strain ATCC MYA-826 / Pb01) TaxID=502779 RepID=C1GUS1_PARBA|nr:mitochondrial 37S ribosomal protein MRPS5 [Paracoccidioides lutzii Pb01]EEH40339.1 37S ribosomal protein S5 [Paracoccidioides lutzii Pb01]
MSLVSPVRCLFCTLSRAPVTSIPQRQFHQSISRCAKKKKPIVSVTPPKKLKPEQFSPYTEDAKKRLAEEYTPEQIAAIEAGEKSIDPRDMASQFAQRDDPWAFKYLDDFSTVEPVVDHHIRKPITKSVPIPRMKTEQELMTEVANYLEQMSEEDAEHHPEKIFEFMNEMDLVKDPVDEASSLVPDITQPYETIDNIGEGPNLQLRREDLKRQARDPNILESEDPEMQMNYEKVSLATGWPVNMLRGLHVKALVKRSVANQTRLGKIRQWSLLSVAGNGRGLLGIGEGKSREFGDAMMQAHARAIRNMRPVLRYEERTIYGDVRGKVGATELQLMHRPPGFGLRCQHNIWEICRAVGIRDLAARVTRSRNKMNTVKAAYEALMSQKDPDDIARARGLKLVDVRRVYYAGAQ